jgi:hypothetical protein
VEVSKTLNISRSGVSVAARRGAEIVYGKQFLLEDLIIKKSTTLRFREIKEGEGVDDNDEDLIPI